MESVAPSSALIQRWEADWRTRASYVPSERRATAHVWEVLQVTDEAAEVGVVAVSADDDHTGWIADVWIVPERRRERHGSRAIQLAEAWALSNGVQELRAATNPADPAQTALFRRFEPASRHMALPLGEQTGADTVDNARLRPMTLEEFGPFLEQAIFDYAKHTAGREPSVDELADARTKTKSFVPQGMETPRHDFLTLRADDVAAAYLWLFHDDDAVETFVFDVVVEESMRGRGYGRTIMRHAEVKARARGMKAIRLHVHENNPVAIKLYESLGYQTTMRFLRRELVADSR